MLCCVTVCSTNATVNLAASDYGPTVEDPLVVRFCKNQNYTIVLEYSVTKSHTLMWYSEIFSRTFIPDSPLCADDDMQSNFSFVLINSESYNNVTDYTSQLRVTTSSLSSIMPDSRQLRVTCRANAVVKETLFIEISGLHPISES